MDGQIARHQFWKLYRGCCDWLGGSVMLADVCLASWLCSATLTVALRLQFTCNVNRLTRVRRKRRPLGWQKKRVDFQAGCPRLLWFRVKFGPVKPPCRFVLWAVGRQCLGKLVVCESASLPAAAVRLSTTVHTRGSGLGRCAIRGPALL